MTLSIPDHNAQLTSHHCHTHSHYTQVHRTLFTTHFLFHVPVRYVSSNATPYHLTSTNLKSMLGPRSNVILYSSFSPLLIFFSLFLILIWLVRVSYYTVYICDIYYDRFVFLVFSLLVFALLSRI